MYFTTYETQKFPRFPMMSTMKMKVQLVNYSTRFAFLESRLQLSVWFCIVIGTSYNIKILSHKNYKHKRVKKILEKMDIKK